MMFKLQPNFHKYSYGKMDKELIEIVDIQKICAPVTRLDGHGKY